MNVTLLHGADAADPPEDPVLGQTEESLRALQHVPTRVPVGGAVEDVIAALRASEPALVVNLAESFDGKSAIESNVAALPTLVGLRYSSRPVYRGALDHAGDLSFPLIVKPPQEDASLGITSKSVVRDVRELLGTMDSLQREFQSPVLVE